MQTNSHKGIDVFGCSNLISQFQIQLLLIRINIYTYNANDTVNKDLGAGGAHE